MKKLFLTFILLFVALSMSAIPARRGWIRYTQPDGSVISIMRHGDEFGHWTTDSQGRVVRQDADGFYRPVAGATVEKTRRQAAARRKSVRAHHSIHMPSASIAMGQKHFLVILVEFQDRAFASTDARTTFSNMMNQKGYSANGATGSARDYYYDNSGGVFEPIFDVYGPVTVSHDMAYYGGNDNAGNDEHPEEAVQEACTLLDDQIDFIDYDNDGDGTVDLVFMYYAGYGEADSDDEDAIWPHQWQLSYAGIGLARDGVVVDNYACTNELIGYGSRQGEMVGIGTACHEFGHAMGLPDFYDTDYETNGQAAALYESFSLMDGGAYNNEGRTPPYLNIVERIMLGWVDKATALQEISASGGYILRPVTENKAYKTPTDQDGEYFIYECRIDEGWDAELPAYGMLVYRVDESSRKVSINDYGQVKASDLWNSWGNYNSINENGKHPCFHIVPAVAQDELLYGYTKHNGYYYFDWDDEGLAAKIPFPGTENVTTFTAKSWNGADSDVSLSKIVFSGTQVIFTAKLPSAGLDYYSIQNPGNGDYLAGSSFTLALDAPEGGSYSSVKWYFDDAEVNDPTVALTAGNHTVEAEISLAGGKTQTVTLEINVK